MGVTLPREKINGWREDRTPIASTQVDGRYYAVVIGCNQDWPDDRKKYGDIGLAETLHLSSLQNVVEVYDDRACKSNILEAISTLGSMRKRGRGKGEDTIFFYYGGHGKRTEFCTATRRGDGAHEPWLKHDEVVDLFENEFGGCVIWCMIDCCHAGGFGEAIVRRYRSNGNKLNAQYGCICASAPSALVGEWWTLTEALVLTFKGMVPCIEGEADPFFISTGLDGKIPVTYPNTQQMMGYHPTWSQLIDYLADEVSRVKGEQMTTLFVGSGFDNGSILRQPCFIGNHDHITSCTASIPRSLAWTEQYLKSTFAVKEEVFVKFNGLAAGVQISKQKIGWFSGRILAINQDDITVEMRDYISRDKWTASIKNAPILRSQPFGFDFDNERCVTVITEMANDLLYYDTSYHSDGDLLEVLYPQDGKYYNAELLSPAEVPWLQVTVEYIEGVHSGPCVAIRWLDDDSYAMIPVECIKRSGSENEGLCGKDRDVSTPLDALKASLSTAEVKLNADAPILGTTDSDKFQARDNEEHKWLDVHLLNTIPISDLPIKVLANHVCYRETGLYSVIFWCSDSMLSLVPNSYLRLRPEEDDSDDDSERGANKIKEEKLKQDAIEVRNYLNVRNYRTQQNRRKQVWHKLMFWCGSVATICGMGSIWLRRRCA